jgi:hypothetical protein
MTSSYDRERRHPRYVAHVEIHIAHAGRHLVTLTRELSKSGLFFFADPPPPVGDRVRVTLYPDNFEPFAVDTIVRYAMAGVGAGVELLETVPSEASRYRTFIEDQARQSETWRVIGGFVRSAEDGDVSSDVEFEPKEMIDVGETCEAFKVFFERYPPIAPELSMLRDDPESVAQARLILSGVSSDPVGIKLHARDRLRRALLGVLLKTPGYVAIVKPARGGRCSFYSLSGREQLMVQEGGRPVFPFFTSTDIARIRRDVMSRVDSGRRRSQSAIDQAGSISLRYLRTNPKATIPPLEKWTRIDASHKTVLSTLFDVLGAETRVYSIGNVERRVRLLNHVTVLVREDGQGEGEEVMLLHDGTHVCVIFGLRTRSNMYVRPLGDRDEIRLPAW